MGGRYPFDAYVRIENAEEICRMISARKATLEERKIYEDWCKEF